MASAPGMMQLDASTFPDLPDGERLVRALNPFISSTTSALQAGLTFRENFAGAVKTLDVVCPDDWNYIATFSNGWAQSSDASRPRVAWRKTADGLAELQGALQGSVSGTVAFTLPRDVWPGRVESRPCVSPMANSSYDVTPNGSVIIYGGTSLTVLQPVSYPCTDRTPLSWTSPVDFALPSSFPGKPGSILVLRAEEMGSTATIAAVSVDGWRLLNDSSAEARRIVRLQRINGLAPGLKYRLTLLVLPD